MVKFYSPAPPFSMLRLDVCGSSKSSCILVSVSKGSSFTLFNIEIGGRRGTLIYYLLSSRFLVAILSCILVSSTRLKVAPTHVVDQDLVTTLCCNSACFACLSAT